MSTILIHNQKYAKTELSRALSYCIERELFSANDFSDTLKYFQTATPKIPIKPVELPVKYRIITAQIRDLSVYNTAVTGGEIHEK